MCKLVGVPSGLLDFISLAFWALKPCDPHPPDVQYLHVHVIVQPLIHLLVLLRRRMMMIPKNLDNAAHPPLIGIPVISTNELDTEYQYSRSYWENA